MHGNIKIYGIIGWPVKHSLSPHMHNAAFKRLGINAQYKVFPVKSTMLAKTIKSFKQGKISGFNVTIPHKSECMRFLDKIEPAARMIGAVNTVVSDGKRLIGYNTDCQGFLKSLQKDLLFKPKSKTAMLIGAGGAARAIAFGLAKSGVRNIYISDIVLKKAGALARSLKRYFPNIKAEAVSGDSARGCIKKIQLLVNCSPLGMHRNDPLPVDPRLLHKGLKVYDVVYTPAMTELVRQAKARGIKSCNGLGMLLYQGVGAFELWTGRKAPVGIMKMELLKRLI